MRKNSQFDGILRANSCLNFKCTNVILTDVFRKIDHSSFPLIQPSFLKLVQLAKFWQNQWRMWIHLISSQVPFAIQFECNCVRRAVNRVLCRTGFTKINTHHDVLSCRSSGSKVRIWVYFWRFDYKITVWVWATCLEEAEIPLKYYFKPRIGSLTFHTCDRPFTFFFRKKRQLRGAIKTLVSTWPEEILNMKEIAGDLLAKQILKSGRNLGIDSFIVMLMDGLVNMKQQSKLSKVDFTGFYIPGKIIKSN